MFRKLVLPVLAMALLGGCISYSYRDGHGGDYYYGEPSVEYRYTPSYGIYGSYGSYGYYGNYGPYRYGYGDRYRHDYGYPYSGRYYRYPYYYVRPTQPRATVDPTPDRPRSPWRDIDQLRRRQHADTTSPSITPRSVPREDAAPAPSGGSSLGGMIRRAKREGGREATP
jgi:hypothetical protein